MVLMAACNTGDTTDPTSTTGPSVTSPATPPASSATTSTDAPPETTSTTVAITTTVATTTTTPPDPLQGLALEPVADGLRQPTAIAVAAGDPRIFVAERTGAVRVIDEDGVVDHPFLDLGDRVESGGIEQGLLGLVFHPLYPDNGRLFAYYVATGGTRRLSEFTAADEGEAAVDSERILLDLPQPDASVDIRHYGGNLVFGPDGHLFVSLGDGADARGQGQNPETPYGAILRIDVDSGNPYSVPPDNVFADGGGAPEIWAYGLRNPWRFAIDPVDRFVYIADVGQEATEEVDVVALDDGGHNFGWPDMEGSSCFLEPDCDPADYVLPVVEYGHDEGCSITGGPVYRGRLIPEMDGHYFYGDWCGQWVRTFRFRNGAAADHQDWTGQLDDVGQATAFGVDPAGEVLVANFAGEVWRIVPVR